MAGPLQCQAQAESDGNADVENLRVAEISLDRLMSRAETVVLRSAADQYAFYIPVSPRDKLRSANLEVVYTNSISLLDSRSQLRVQLNGKVLAQASLRAREPEGVLKVNLPPALIEPGYNQLKFAVAQHYVEQCEDPTAAELWTQIDVAASRLTFAYEDRTVSNNLAELPELVDPLGWDPYAVTIVTPGGLEDRDLTIGAKLSSGLAALLRYRPLQVSHANAIRMQEDLLDATEAPPALRLANDAAGGDVVLVGTADELEPFLSARMAAEITGPYLGMSQLPADHSKFVLVVSGRDAAELATAATAFALSAGTLPDSASMTVRQITPPELPRYAHTNAISAGQRYAFSAFGVENTTLGGPGSDRLEFDLWIPPDLFAPADTMLELHVHMAYGAGADPTSVVNVELNDRFASAIRMVSEDGGVFRDYVIPIPAAWLQPGRNTLRFRTYMTPVSEGDVCFTPSDAALLVSLFDDSWLVLSDSRHHVELPNLQLLSRTGFPYTAPADGSELQVRVGNLDSDTVAAAWTLLGKLAQLGAVPPWQASVTSNSSVPANRHELLVGALPDLPAEIMGGAPVAFGDRGLLKPELLRIPSGQPESRSLRSFFPAGTSLAHAEPAAPALAAVSYEARSGNRAFLLQFESPLSPGRLVSVATAADPRLLKAAVARLVEHDLWGGIAGDLVSWAPDSETVSAATVGSSFHLGEKDISSRASFYFSERPAVWLGLLGSVALVFVFLSVYLLRRRAREQA